MEFARRPRRRSTIELTPLIDVVFQLLVFFLLTSSFVQPSLRLDLPRGATLDDPDPTPIIVEIDAEGQIAVDGEIVESDELVPALEAAIADGRSAVRLSGDANMNYGAFMEALDAARTAGAAHFDLVHGGPADQ